MIDKYNYIVNYIIEHCRYNYIALYNSNIKDIVDYFINKVLENENKNIGFIKVIYNLNDDFEIYSKDNNIIKKIYEDIKYIHILIVCVLNILGYNVLIKDIDNIYNFSINIRKTSLYLDTCNDEICNYC